MVRLDLAQKLQATLDDRLVGFDAGVQKCQHDEAGFAAAIGGSQTPVNLPVSVVLFLIAQELDPTIDGSAYAVHEQFLVAVLRGR